MQARLHEENERCLLYLDAGTHKALIATSEKQLLDRHTSGILDKVQLTTEFVPLVIGVVGRYCECAIFYLARLPEILGATARISLCLTNKAT